MPLNRLLTKRVIIYGLLLFAFNAASAQSDSTYSSVELAVTEPLKVKTLDLNNQRLIDIGIDISMFKNLHTLVLVGNPKLDFEQVLTDAASCPKLSVLYLDDNKLERLPTALGKLTNLIFLELNYNNFKELDSTILSELVNLKYLNLFRCLNLDLPQALKTIGQLPHLENLSLLQNHLKVLPPEIRYCTSLKKLDLRMNSLSTLPKEIAELKQLEILYLTSNKIASIPPEMRKMNLRIIDVRDNNLSDQKLKGFKEILEHTQFREQ
jgi:Leucine-rich repeat (LRR) protein